MVGILSFAPLRAMIFHCFTAFSVNYRLSVTVYVLNRVRFVINLLAFHLWYIQLTTQYKTKLKCCDVKFNNSSEKSGKIKFTQTISLITPYLRLYHLYFVIHPGSRAHILHTNVFRFLRSKQTHDKITLQGILMESNSTSLHKVPNQIFELEYG